MQYHTGSSIVYRIWPALVVDAFVIGGMASQFVPEHYAYLGFLAGIAPFLIVNKGLSKLAPWAHRAIVVLVYISLAFGALIGFGLGAFAATFVAYNSDPGNKMTTIDWLCCFTGTVIVVLIGYFVNAGLLRLLNSQDVKTAFKRVPD